MDYDAEIGRHEATLRDLDAQLEGGAAERVRKELAPFAEATIRKAVDHEITKNTERTAELTDSELSTMKGELGDVVSGLPARIAEHFTPMEPFFATSHASAFKDPFRRAGAEFEKRLQVVIGPIGVVLQKYGYLKVARGSVFQPDPSGVRSALLLDPPSTVQAAIQNYLDLVERKRAMTGEVTSLRTQKEQASAKDRWDRA